MTVILDSKPAFCNHNTYVKEQPASSVTFYMHSEQHFLNRITEQQLFTIPALWQTTVFFWESVVYSLLPFFRETVQKPQASVEAFPIFSTAQS